MEELQALARIPSIQQTKPSLFDMRAVAIPIWKALSRHAPLRFLGTS